MLRMPSRTHTRLTGGNIAFWPPGSVVGARNAGEVL